MVKWPIIDIPAIMNTSYLNSGIFYDWFYIFFPIKSSFFRIFISNVSTFSAKYKIFISNEAVRLFISWSSTLILYKQPYFNLRWNLKW